MVRYKKKWYIASSKGSLYKSGWRKYSGNYYYLKECVVQTNQFMKKNGVNGYPVSYTHLIDDVYTTGSTIDAMAGCLKRKGAGNVYFLTVFIGRR